MLLNLLQSFTILVADTAPTFVNHRVAAAEPTATNDSVAAAAHTLLLIQFLLLCTFLRPLLLLCKFLRTLLLLRTSP